jgi:hypothetical protein
LPWSLGCGKNHPFSDLHTMKPAIVKPQMFDFWSHRLFVSSKIISSYTLVTYPMNIPTSVGKTMSYTIRDNGKHTTYLWHCFTHITLW